MARVFRQQYTRPFPPDAQRIIHKGKAAVRFKGTDGKAVVAFLTKKGDRCRLASPTWYGWVDGAAVPLCTNKTAAELMLAELVRKSERAEAGISDPFEQHCKRPLAEHLADWEASLLASGSTAKHVKQTLACARRVFEACGFVFMADLSASRVQQYLARLREQRRALPPLDSEKAAFTRQELAALLGLKPCAVSSLVSRHHLAATGYGKARRYPKGTAEALCALRSRGRSIKTSNLYLDAIKGFTAWLVQDRRAADNPLVHLSGGNVKLDRRHDRRAIPLDELRAVFEAAARSDITFRGLSGPDRHILYLTACATGFRAEELACLRPESFDFDAAPPVAILGASETKNRQGATQPLPADVAAALRDYLQGRPAGVPLWPGNWWKRGADMLRIDLDAAGIPYAVEGPDGPLYADFHALRHSFVALLEKSGATLKEAMQLARHSDPKLTMAVYGRAQLHDLGRAVERLPDLMAGPGTEAVAATGTDGAAPDSSDKLARRIPLPYSALTGVTDRGGDSLRLIGTPVGGNGEGGVENTAGHNPLILQGVAAGCDPVIADEGAADSSSPTRTRTWNKPVNSRLLYH
jgi:integrase